ncbi:probable LRR receptor-like serine/threonine-protein kinase At1g56140 isoform X2 [Tripterygium wilfordii]|uniref:probable LRR receptor-like serine/threonine-protein kinase At1g56140 isoform X2 n=1 Tax=Tripterygium wilfordii TaxID=458696 RepID=UPI0018F80AFB|nr:probable LRR receptor-like serine/threonine-protein kinase At1g56140 isoform X2 [Tripterygium wilfordii]
MGLQHSGSPYIPQLRNVSFFFLFFILRKPSFLLMDGQCKAGFKLQLVQNHEGKSYRLMGFLGFTLLFVCVLQVAYAQPATAPEEVAALNKVIDHWNLRDKLNMITDPCAPNASWAPENANPRVACDCNGNSCHITHLKIYALDISGEIPGELFVLKQLMDLNLGQNVLNGSIPPDVGQLTNMQYLSLGINNLTGPVPPELGNLSKLISLSFSSNNFFGQLPKELGNLTSLQQLYIDSSGVSGPIPQEFAKLKSLQILWASDNMLSGKLPEFFGTLTELKDLRLQGTSLEGPIPSSFAALNKLEDLRIGDLNGEDSSLDFLEVQTRLSILILRNCGVAGQIPEQLRTFTLLEHLDLSFNKLTGRIPTSFQNLASLQFLYLGNNNLSGDLPADLIGPKLIVLDVSFNPISGNLPQSFAKAGLSVNVLETSINTESLQDSKASGVLKCLQGNTKCTDIILQSSFSIKCGGSAQKSASGIEFDGDSEDVGAASFYTSPDDQWAVSNTGNFISNPNGPQYIAKTDSQITGTLNSELYKTARISASSLRYYGLGLKNGRYNVELHFAEIAMDDSYSWRGLGRRLFDIYIQGERVLQDLNIRKEAGGSKRALIKRFEANVTNSAMDIHFFWAGKGTCCIPFQSTYGPLVSAIHVSQVSDSTGASKRNKKRIGRIVGITAGCVAGAVVISSLVYLWWTKEAAPKHMRVHTDSPK